MRTVGSVPAKAANLVASLEAILHGLVIAEEKFWSLARRWDELSHLRGRGVSPSQRWNNVNWSFVFSTVPFRVQDGTVIVWISTGRLNGYNLYSIILSALTTKIFPLLKLSPVEQDAEQGFIPSRVHRRKQPDNFVVGQYLRLAVGAHGIRGVPALLY